MELKDLKELIKFLDRSGFTEFEYEGDSYRIYLSKQSDTAVPQQQIQYMPVQTQTQPQQLNAPVEVKQEPVKVEDKTEPAICNTIEIKSPIVGTFYEAPAPGAAPFVKEGDFVRKGKTLCIVEAMKIMNEIEAEFDCKIIRKIGKNSEPVEYGETIFVVEPA